MMLPLAAEEVFDGLQEHLKIAIAAFICQSLPRSRRPVRVQTLADALAKGDVMTDVDLPGVFGQDTENLLVAPSRCRRKRRRASQACDTTRQARLRAQLSQLLVGDETQDLLAISNTTDDRYSRLEEPERCQVWQALLDLVSSDLQVTLQLMRRLIEVPGMQQGKRSRIVALFALRTGIEKAQNPLDLDMSTSPFGQFCLRSIHSGFRELRTAAGRCLASFLRSDLDPDLRRHNCQVTLEYLRVLSKRTVANEQEMLVSAWSQIALACEDSELHLALIHLVDYLGHSNPLISGLAFVELERILTAKNKSAEDVFRPFWGTIAVSVVRDLHARPQKAERFCELIGAHINHFLLSTMQDTIPALVLAKKKDVLQRIAAARGCSVKDLFMKPRTHLAAILGLLLSIPGDQAEETAMSCLRDAAPDLQTFDLPSLVQLDASLVGCNLLKHIGDQPEGQKRTALDAFFGFAIIAERRPGQPKSKSRSKMVASFFDSHRLGIMTHFSETLENSSGMYPLSEQARCIKAIGEMISIDKGRVSAALPQVRAALQSAMEQPSLCDPAFDAWMKLLSELNAEDVAHIVDQSFVLVLRHWFKLAPGLQSKIHESLGQLTRDHNAVIHDHIMTLPSLTSVSMLSKLGGEIERLREHESLDNWCKAFTQRLRDESGAVVLRALDELVVFLEQHQEYVHESAASEQPTLILTDLVRALLDATVKYSSDSAKTAQICGKALGIVGCVDPNRIDTSRKKRRVLLLSNFEKASEVVDWVMVLLEDVFVNAFKSVTNSRAQGFLAFTMQELLRFCGFTDAAVLKSRSSQPSVELQKWSSMPEHVRITLTPLVNSRYIISSGSGIVSPSRKYPGFAPAAGHSSWLRGLVTDLLLRGKGENASMVFPLLARVIRNELSIASFVLPYTALNVVLGGVVAEVHGISNELLAVLSCNPSSSSEDETIKLCSEHVFEILDYMSTWLKEKRKRLGETRATAYRTGLSPSDWNESTDMAQIENIEQFLGSIPADVIATRAVTCGSFARALFHWEQYIRQKRPLMPSGRPMREQSGDHGMYDRLLDIYAQIDEPDGFEGISAHLSILSGQQEATLHEKGGRWTAAQAWYELQLATQPESVDLQEKLIGCLEETGRYTALLRYADSFLERDWRDNTAREQALHRILPAVCETHWKIGDLDGLKRRLELQQPKADSAFNFGLGDALLAISGHQDRNDLEKVEFLRQIVSQAMTTTDASSVQTGNAEMKKLHVLYEIEALQRVETPQQVKALQEVLERRLAIVGSHTLDKQYILSVRRAVMQARPDVFDQLNIGLCWLETARLARRAGNTESAYAAVLKASDCGAKEAKLEEARLLWRDGHQRHAIQSLESAIASGALLVMDTQMRADERDRTASKSSTSSLGDGQNPVSAKAYLMLAKWLDASGQTQTKDMTDKYQSTSRALKTWEKGHYYLARHYQKLLEAEQSLPENKQTDRLASGEMTKMVVENYLRSIPFGNKYWHQSIPKILTLWLDLGMKALARGKKEDLGLFDRRARSLQTCNTQLKKYFDRVQPYVFYSAIPQMISRLTHPHPEIWKQLCNILTRIVSAHPSQALWSLLAVIKASDPLRVSRGSEILQRLKETKRREGSTLDFRMMVHHGQRLSEGLLRACEAPVEPRATWASLSKDLGFNHKLAPSQLVVPIEVTLTPSLPTGGAVGTIRRHKAFVQDKITIASFADDVLVLSSLQKPRKLTVRGSDGKQYGLLCKPKDDLRKDQRLMEFNGIINRALKKDLESSKRRLYIKTFAVTPLSEESGTIEWVEGIKPIRDILLGLYARRGVRPHYQDLKKTLDQACTDPSQSHIFVEKVLPIFPPVMHEWFTETYAEPDTWFAARLRYARSAAVMSMTGHILGLGDRHGENILLEESTGGVFHVDFNCLFDKGLTFEKPELVPFRLTHNMVDAMGAYGYEGPFRKSSELTLRLLRQSQDTLMTVLETFLYDPTTDFVEKKKRQTPGVPDTPQAIMDSVESKLRGLLRGESVALSCEGQADALIREATSPFCLASMYIGWCAFL